jgi:hypothetical protein
LIQRNCIAGSASLGRVRSVGYRQIELFSAIETDLVGPPFDCENAAHVAVTATEGELENPTQRVHQSYDQSGAEKLAASEIEISESVSASCT